MKTCDTVMKRLHKELDVLKGKLFKYNDPQR